MVALQLISQMENLDYIVMISNSLSDLALY